MIVWPCASVDRAAANPSATAAISVSARTNRAPFVMCSLLGAMGPRGGDGSSMRVPQTTTAAREPDRGGRRAAGPADVPQCPTAKSFPARSAPRTSQSGRREKSMTAVP